MQITISYDSGLQLEAFVLSVREDTLRVAVRNWEDAAEYHFREGRWFSEFGVAVRFDSMLVETPDEWTALNWYETRALN